MARKLNLQKSKLLLRVLGQAWRIRPWAVAGFFVGAIAEICAFLLTIFASAQIAGLLARYTSGSPTSEIWFWLWVDIAAAAVLGLSFWLMSWTKQLVYYRMTSWATNEFQQILCRIDIQDFYDEKTRNQLNKVESGYTWKISNVTQATMDLVYAILRFIVTAIVVAQINWWLIPLIILFLIPTLLVENRMAKVTWFVWDSKGDTRQVFWGLTWIMRQAKSQMELRSTQARAYVTAKIDAMMSDFYHTQERESARLNRYLVPSKVLEVAGTAVGSVLLLKQFLGGAISLERYFFLSGALLRIGGALNTIFGTLGRIYDDLFFVEDFFALLDRQPSIVDKPGAAKLDGTKPPSIEFQNITFTYPGQTKPVFKDLSFTIASGEHVALVGENGAGKSTLIKLLLRFYLPDSGQILIDGKNLQDIEIESWYSQLATLFQDFNSYPFPVRENIEVGRPQFAGDKKRLQSAAKFSNVDTLVKQYKHGWDTVLDNSFEKGVEPSGGQWQRVALARAFYRDANVLILDEPTAAIDAKAEYDIFNNIFAHYGGKTALIVSHRFSTVRRADTIMVVDNGRIIERGSHQELMKQKGLYHELFTKQAEGYRD
ncbi:MAG: ABC transporter ATP-binding protein [Candidatus Saccharimonadales bacterium]